VSEIKAKFIHDVPNGAVTRIAGEGITVRSVQENFGAAPLLARRQLVIVSDLLLVKEVAVHSAVAAFLERLQQANDSNVIVFFETEIKQAGPLLNWLKANALCQAFPVLDSRQIAAWVVAACKERGRAITPGAVAQLVTGSGGDNWRLLNEIEKLHAYVPVNAPITEDVVAILFTPTGEDKIFAMIDAVIRGETDTASSLLNRLLADGAAAENIVSLLEQQLRTVLLLQLDASGSALRGVHPYVIQKLLPVARRSGMLEIRNAYAALAEVDVSIKQGTVDAKTGLLQFAMTSFAKVS
jgi:DNA polymerase-3 subunit delta